MQGLIAASASRVIRGSPSTHRSRARLRRAAPTGRPSSRSIRRPSSRARRRDCRGAFVLWGVKSWSRRRIGRWVDRGRTDRARGRVRDAGPDVGIDRAVRGDDHPIAPVHRRLSTGAGAGETFVTYATTRRSPSRPRSVSQFRRAWLRSPSRTSCGHGRGGEGRRERGGVVAVRERDEPSARVRCRVVLLRHGADHARDRDGRLSDSRCATGPWSGRRRSRRWRPACGNVVGRGDQTLAPGRSRTCRT